MEYGDWMHINRYFYKKVILTYAMLRIDVISPRHIDTQIASCFDVGRLLNFQSSRTSFNTLFVT